MRRHGRGDGRKQLLVCDEFAVLLDRVSAATVARSLRRAIDRLGRVGVPLAAAVATSHDDLRPALLPDRVRWCEC
jgi:ABC-type ATPase with predicted acetyltransferase domain